ncbi:MAG: kynureninase [Kordiimonadaceae bacterium]|nr:kynureninase [Kordiimonadaceae bacterium]
MAGKAKRYSLGDIAALDAADPLAPKRQEFAVPKGLIYLDGNSLGMMPMAVKNRVTTVVAEEWGNSLIRAWNSHSWIDLPERVGAKIGTLIGAEKNSVVVTDSTSINVAKAVSAALSLNPNRRVILTDNSNFPTDIYMAQGVADVLGKNHTVKVVAPEKLYEALDDTVAVLMVTQVGYKTGLRQDMQKLTACAHDAGAITVWDLCHSAGAFEVDLAGCHADFAVGCTYKYLNGGPGSPAFIYVAPRHQDAIQPMLTGWIGHQAPFAFDLEYRPAEGIKRLNVGTPPVLALSALETALEVWDDVSMAAVREKSVALCELFITEVEARCGSFGLELASPRDAAQRGSQISFHCPEGYKVMRALVDNSVVGDFRMPDVIRFGFTPLYVSYEDVFNAAKMLEKILREGLWQNPLYDVKEKVT